MAMDWPRPSILLFDGGFGSQAAAMELPMHCAEMLSITHASQVRAIHRAYVEAGAQVVETNTLGASPMRLALHGLAHETARITALSVSHAIASGARYVACSMGTTATPFSPAGALTWDSALQGFATQAKAARDAGADVLFTETLIDVREARAMWIAAKSVGIPFCASFTFFHNLKTQTGSTPKVCALTAAAMGADMVGINCVGDAAVLLEATKRMREVCSLPIVVQPNAGQPRIEKGKAQYPVTPQALAETMSTIMDLGVSAIGGCCGTTPEHIRAMQPLSAAAPMPTPGGDGIARICSLHACIPLTVALEAATRVSPCDAEKIATMHQPVMLDLRSISPNDAEKLVWAVQSSAHPPLLFRANDTDTLNAALRVYAGVAAVDGPSDFGYGALRI